MHPLVYQQTIRSSLVKLYFNSLSHLMCFTWSICVLLFLLCYFMNKLDPSILVWERYTLRFFMWILISFTYICSIFLSSYCNAFSSCFSCISCSELLVLVEKVLSCLLIELFRGFYVQISLLVFGWKQKMLHVVHGIWKRHTHACRSLSWIIWCFAIFLSSQVDLV